MVIVAIDPGQHGGVAVQCGTQQAFAKPMPDTARDLRLLLQTAANSGQPLEVFVEAQTGCAGMRVSAPAMFKFGQNYGTIMGLCEALGYRVRLVRPQEWMKGLGLGVRGGLSRSDWKRKLKQEAERLYPHIHVTLDTADALLLLEYAIRTKGKGEQHA
jgi:hypothetical protein